MSYERRKVMLMDCDCMVLKGEFQTVHCENADGEMRCETCGRIKE